MAIGSNESAEVKLTRPELDQALCYVRQEGQFLYVPDQFELNAIAAAWDNVRPVLSRVNLRAYDPKEPVEFVAPKQKFAVRPVQLLDPVDLLLLTGLGLRLAPLIEDRRNALGRDLVYSWRYRTGADGNPGFVSDWDGWVQAAASRRDRYAYVGTTYIVDFFPRIYHHRLENALSALTQSELETKAVMRLLGKWCHGTSYGIPIGPRICGILSEALLQEVDEFLVAYSFDFIRFSDDYLLFGDTHSACLRGLFELAARFQSTQGLSLNMAKTRVVRTTELLEDLKAPDDKARQSREQVIRDVFGGNPYAELEYEELSDEDKKVIDTINWELMLKEALEPDLVDIRTVNSVLNILANLRKTELAPMILDNLDRLSPAALAVARFLSAFAGEERARPHIAARVLQYLREPTFVPDYYAFCLLEPFVNDPGWGHIAELRVLARQHRNRMVRRQAILALGNTRDRSSLLDLKSSLDDAKDWEWRAILYACRGLPKDERKAFWRSVGFGKKWTLDNVVANATLAYAQASTGPP